MPPRKREPWWHANTAWLVALLIAVASGWLNDRWRAAGNDRLINSFELRIAALEARCK
jgi:hypothetical protein